MRPTSEGTSCGALKTLEAQGKPLAEMIARELERDPIRVLQATARFLPREEIVGATVTARSGQPQQEHYDAITHWIEELVAEQQRSEPH